MKDQMDEAMRFVINLLALGVSGALVALIVATIIHEAS
jgi:hypothetical protein